MDEELGGLRRGDSSAKVEQLFGKPASTTKEEYSPADGATRSIWRYPSKGLDVVMGKVGENDEFVVDQILVDETSALKTERGIGIGSSAEDVREAYRDELASPDEAGTDEDTIVAGSIYGGIVFTIKGGLVHHIFVGAAAE